MFLFKFNSNQPQKVLFWLSSGKNLTWSKPSHSYGSNTALGDGSGQEPQWPVDEDDKLCKKKIMDRSIYQTRPRLTRLLKNT